MCTAITFCPSTKSETIGLLSFSGDSHWSSERAAYPRVVPKSKVNGSRVTNVLADSEHLDPEHVWGDEGPVNN